MLTCKALESCLAVWVGYFILERSEDSNRIYIEGFWYSWIYLLSLAIGFNKQVTCNESIDLSKELIDGNLFNTHSEFS